MIPRSKLIAFGLEPLLTFPALSVFGERGKPDCKEI